MMTAWIVAFCLVVATVVQGLLPSLPFLGQAKPPVLLAVVLYFALMRRPGVSLATAVCAGLLLDAFGQGRIGISVICFLIIAWVVNESRDKLFGRRPSTQMMLGAFGSGFMIVTLYVFQIMDSALYLPFFGMLSKAYGTMLLGIVTVPLVFKLLEWTDRRLGIVVQVREEA